MASPRKYDLNERLIDYAVMIIKLMDRIAKNEVGKHLGNQLMRSATSTSLNYGEAQGAESDRDFIHKLRLVLKELRESKNSMLILVRSDNVSKCDAELQETNEIIAIFTKSIGTARGR
jgi:four helix bundle protein